MNKETLKALKESIQHWDRLATGKQRDDENIGESNCALCALFIREACHGCPVNQKTDKNYCYGSPYREAESAINRFGLLSAEFRAAALVERDFLISLLPEGETWEPAP